jgi:aerobic-type carbon monoxide dehydrogenase small subunit (CoxS/CutS family)
MATNHGDTQRYMTPVSFFVNGGENTLGVEHHRSLLDVLRDELGLTGAKRGCDRGECGSCTVLLNGAPVNACQVLAARIDGAHVLTVEGLSAGGELSPVQQAFLDEDGGQCGFCTPGFVIAARALLDTNGSPSDAEIREALSGNLCRCNAYGRILASVRAAAERGA